MTGVLLVMSPCVAKSLVHTKQVHFDKGTNETTLHGTVKGYNTVEYKLFAEKGDSMQVSLDSTVAYFNIFSPHKGSGDSAMFIGSIDGENYVRKLSKSGTYTIQVYLMRNEARRDTRALYSLHIKID